MRLNCINQNNVKIKLSIKIKGKAKPKKAGIQNTTGEIYAAVKAIICAIIIKLCKFKISLLNQDNFCSCFN